MELRDIFHIEPIALFQHFCFGAITVDVGLINSIFWLGIHRICLFVLVRQAIQMRQMIQVGQRIL